MKFDNFSFIILLSEVAAKDTCNPTLDLGSNKM